MKVLSRQVVKSSSRGFTLIELLLVLIILAVLAGIAAPIYLGQSDRAKASATTASISNIKSALRTFEVTFGRFPTTDEGLDALINPPLMDDGEEHEPFLDADTVPVDGWGNPFQYRCPGSVKSRPYEIWSWGANKIDESGEGDDITSWTKSR